MGKEQSTDLNNMSEEELRALQKEAQLNRDYQLELKLCQLLFKHEKNPCLASTYIKELENHLQIISQQEGNQN